MDIAKLKASAEAVLFASGEPVDGDRLSEALDISGKDTERIITALNDGYLERGSALRILTLDGNYALTTAPEYAEVIRTVLDIRRAQPLSQAALEVLSVIAYNQPVTKNFVEQVRGVDSSGVMNTLVEKGLIIEAGRLDLPGRPISYRTTDLFLSSFSISGLDMLPPLPKDDETTKEESSQLTGFLDGN